MFVHTTDDKKRTLHTHTTLLDDDKSQKVFATFATDKYLKNGATFFGFWLSMEAVNRLSALKNKGFYMRAGIVGLSALCLPKIISSIYWTTNGNTEIKKALNGAPVWEKKYDVPELDKLYFELEDLNNYEPTLLHHGQSNLLI